MSYNTIPLGSGFSRAVLDFVGSAGSYLRTFCSTAMMAGSRGSHLRLCEKLQAKTDEELAELGIKRDEIAYHVFRDMYYI